MAVLRASHTLIVCVSVCFVLSHVPVFTTLWTVAHQAPLSVGSSRQEYWSGLPFPSPGDLPDQGSNTGLLHHRRILHQLSPQGSPLLVVASLISEHGLWSTQAQVSVVPALPLQHMESSWTRDQDCVPCIGRRILNHWITKVVL